MKLKVKVKNARNVADVLSQVTPNEAKNLVRATVHGVAGEVRDQVRFRAPDDPYTTSGDIIRTTKTRRMRQKGLLFRSAVTIGAFYWRFHEFEYGGVKHPPRPFVLPAVEAVRPHIGKIFRDQFVLKLSARIERKLKASRDG